MKFESVIRGCFQLLLHVTSFMFLWDAGSRTVASTLGLAAVDVAGRMTEAKHEKNYANSGLHRLGVFAS